MKSSTLLFLLFPFLFLTSCKSDKQQSLSPEPVEKDTKRSEKKSYYQNGKLRTVEVLNDDKSQVIETKLYDSINGNLLTVLTPASAKTKLNEWYEQYFNQNDILQIKYGDLNNNGIAEDAIVLVNRDESSYVECFVFIKNKNGGFIKEGQNFDIAIHRDSISTEFLEQGFKLNTKHSFEHQWERSVSFKREGQKWYLDKDVFTDYKDKNYVFMPKEIIELTDFNPKKNLPKELGINLENENEEREVVVVSSVEELLDGIDNYTTIYLRPGEYNLSTVNDYKRRTTEEGIVDNQIRSIEEPVDENRKSNSQLFIYDVNSLSIIGLGKVKVTTDQDHASVIEFQNCYNILLKNIESYHNVEGYTCSAPVISFNESKDSKVSYCLLNGSGETGIALYGSKSIEVENTIMTNCSREGIYLKNSNDCYFYNCKVIENNTKSDGNIIDSQSSNNIVFKNCVFANNNLKQGAALETRNDTLVFDKCVFKNNISGMFLNIKDRDHESPSRMFMVHSKYRDTTDYKEYITKINDSFSVSVKQNGEKVKIVDNVVMLKKEPFDLEIYQPKDLLIRLNISSSDTIFNILKSNKHFNQVESLKVPILHSMTVDFSDQNSLYVSEDGFMSLFYDNSEESTYSKKAIFNNNHYVLTKIVDSFYPNDNLDKKLSISEIDKDLFLSFIYLIKISKQPSYKGYIEGQRFFLNIKWIN
ncbi:right-handed parallel beta-helix repeat-containing protein [Aquimarina hainanensis]|uniref:Right-handed parallel beta-helix repeat-containing protein n=1 Tax=Aquimarina hainanensis TaxID=1578017 RepID=A0ABW5N3L4_9FLAO